MSPKRQLTKQQVKAVHLVVDDSLTDEEIAAQVGITRRQLSRWKRNPLFVDEVTRVVAKFDEQLLRIGVATRRRRVEALNDRWHRMQEVIDARSSDPSTTEIPGADTGLLVRQYKGVGRGADFQIVEEYAVDTGLLREMREHERQAAAELGQWVEKVAPTSPDGATAYEPLPESERVERVAQLLDAARARRSRQAAPDAGDVGTSTGASS